MNADGTNQRRVIGLQGQSESPAFSPDGRRLVFSSLFSSVSSQRLMIVNVDGTGRRDLTVGTGVNDIMPDWGPRGIVFVRLQPGRSTLWTIQPDGSGLRALLPAGGLNPVWSPDGTRVVFRDEWNIKVFNSLDGTTRVLTLPRGFSIVIYIKPGRPNTINPKIDSRIPVAILSAPWFDPVRQIDQTSITFGPTGNERSPSSCAAEDVSQDGVHDLVCYFDVAASFSPAHTEGILRAKGFDGVLYEGRDAVRVLSP